MDRGRVLDVVGTVARLGLAAVWLTSGVLKAIDPDQTYIAVRAYDVLPPIGVEVVAGILPWFEIALGVLLLVGVGIRTVGVLSVLLLLGFVAGVSQAWARGLLIDCGCFGGGGAVAPGQTAYVQELLRDTGFIVLAAWLVARPRTLLSLDSRLENTGRT
ncbi:MauE/DoxX family redox-associated membrane protein [Pseudonocardia xinjiangensis]|uniref:DoxX family protein n=1 Tax=Pseudonocardia xinjiangensis TaxID=75289 RepID=A0ABX1RB31_9PSEU|nr:MauE/DoxX family redox-associated membrane protein [Pseudonocardia xinjiangensis]NMH76418.1 DoxX family protein [Pseudonocardia xinjiangensis]